MLSPNVPEGPRNPNGYTGEEVLRALRGLDGHRKTTFRYELLDQNLEVKRDLENVMSGSVSHQYIAAIKRTASFQIRDDGDIDYLHDHIKPYCQIWLPPRWSEERRIPEWAWVNNFSAEVSGAVTQENVQELGDGFNLLYGEADYVESPRISSTASIRFGSDTGDAAGFVSMPTPIDQNIRRFRSFFFCEEGAATRVAWMDEDGDVYGTGTPGQEDGGGFAINGVFSGVWLAGTNFGASVYNQLRDRWMRVEIDHDYNDMHVYYRLYWSNPYGNTPDHVHDAPLNVPNRVQQFRVEKWEDTGSFPTARIYLGPTRLGGIRVIEPRPNPTDKDFVEFPLGVFRMTSPVRQLDEGDLVTREIEAFDRTQLLIDDKLTERFVIVKGQNYTDVLNGLLANYPRVIEPSTWVCGRTREFSVGTEIKEVVDRIAESINYHTVRVDEEGRFVLRPYVSPGDRSPEFHYSDDEVSIMESDVEVEFDAFDIANVWIVSLNEADEGPVYVKLENHDPGNPFSIPRRGRKIVDYREGEEGFDRASLMRKAKRIQFEANRVYENVFFTTMINPLHSDNDCYTMEYAPLGVNQKYTEYNWEFNLDATATMSHSCRRIVELDPELYDGFVDGHLQVNGAATMSNMKWGQTPGFAQIANKPVSFNVTGLGLQGTGPTRVFLTGNSAVPGTARACGVKDRTANGFVIWSYRTTATATSYYWVAMRDV